jgi:hypothetical protein
MTPLRLRASSLHHLLIVTAGLRRGRTAWVPRPQARPSLEASHVPSIDSVSGRTVPRYDTAFNAAS